MGVSKITEVICDYSGCTGGNPGPAVVSWNDTKIQAGKEEVPELAKYLVVFTQGETTKAFCCQLHAAEFFLPPGYEARQKQVIEFPKSGNPDNGRESGDA